MFPTLNFPKYQFKIEKRGANYFVWDVLRQKKLLLTPEEWVRQHVLHFFMEDLNYPGTLMKCEHPVPLGENTQRADIVVFNDRLSPKIVVECKAPAVTLTQAAVDQACRYNYKLNASVLILTNGLRHLVYTVEEKEVKLLNEIPDWDTLNA